jgi:hypothetical protein
MSVDANEPRESFSLAPAATRHPFRADSHRLPLQDDSFAFWFRLRRVETKNPAKTEAHGGSYDFGFRRVLFSGGIVARVSLRGGRMLAATGTTYLFSGR